VTSNETFQQQMCASGVDCEVALTAHALCVVSQWVQSVPQVYGCILGS
jgi:hypothetical protein